MGTSRDANDPRDQLRAMNKEARAEFERDEVDDTGGQEHASRADREGAPARPRQADAATGEAKRAARTRDYGRR
jgi:hypothetical protein